MLPAIPLIPIIFVASLLVVILVLVVVLVWMELHRKRQPHLALEAEPVAPAVIAPPLMTTPTPSAPPPTTSSVTPPSADVSLKQETNATCGHTPIACPHCHAPNKDDALFCTQCGSALSSLTPAPGDTDATKPLPVLVEAAPPTSAKVASGAKTQQPGIVVTLGKTLDLHDTLNNTLATAARPLSLTVSRLSDVGLVREINEDSLATLELVQVYNSVPSSLHLFAVADGMGGHAAGEVASHLALKCLQDSIRAQQSAAAPAGPLAMLKQAGQEAARAVHTEAQRTRSDMGTTLVAALVDSTARKLYAINVGDSRLYKIDATAIRQVTKDHSLVQRLLDSGQLTPAEARHHPNANLIYRTLGERANVEIDTFEEALAPGETLLLCTDGLCGLVDDDDLHRVVTTAPSPHAACARLVELAKAAGGHDNITVIVAAALSDAAPLQERPT